MAETLKGRIAAEAKALGFDAVRFTSADAVRGAGQALDAFLDEGRQGDMAWLATTAERRKAPRALWPRLLILEAWTGAIRYLCIVSCYRVRMEEHGMNTIFELSDV